MVPPVQLIVSHISFCSITQLSFTNSSFDKPSFTLTMVSCVLTCLRYVAWQLTGQPNAIVKQWLIGARTCVQACRSETDFVL
jgi:hypothetical protein